MSVLFIFFFIIFAIVFGLLHRSFTPGIAWVGLIIFAAILIIAVDLWPLTLLLIVGVIIHIKSS